MLEGKVQDIVELETMYLGVIAAETTKINDDIEKVDLNQVEENTRAIVEMIGGRPLLYFGARHWHYAEDADIAEAAYRGGAAAAATDIGAAKRGQKGLGTIPHALENIYAAIFGRENAVVEATKAFDRVIDPAVPRVALIDYNNQEITDSIAVADALEGRLFGVRVDTCGENVAQGALVSEDLVPVDHPLKELLKYIPDEDKKFWFGNGVTISGVFALRQALDKAGHEKVQIFLSSGFGKKEKVQAFLRAEALLQIKLFDSLGVGGLYKPCRTTTMDIVSVASSFAGLDSSPMSKVGRLYKPNPKLKPALVA
ncbi:MAG: nicotinate phosphoribosyltransferase [Bdellovibrionota bacterium]